jgi:hypothetical protein
MPAGTRVSKCVKSVMKSGKAKSNAIAICQSSVHQSYASGRTKTKAGKTVGGPKRKRKSK